MECKYTTMKEIEQIIKSLKTKKLIWVWPRYPQRSGKYTVIKPLHKNGDRHEVSKYRPVSLLTSFSKMFEMVLKTRILKHLTKYNILSTEQYGFRIGLKLCCDKCSAHFRVLLCITSIFVKIWWKVK
jgi:hypothetical protein